MCPSRRTVDSRNKFDCRYHASADRLRRQTKKAHLEQKESLSFDEHGRLSQPPNKQVVEKESDSDQPEVKFTQLGNQLSDGEVLQRDFQNISSLHNNSNHSTRKRSLTSRETSISAPGKTASFNSSASWFSHWARKKKRRVSVTSTWFSAAYPAAS